MPVDGIRGKALRCRRMDVRDCAGVHSSGTLLWAAAVVRAPHAPSADRLARVAGLPALGAGVPGEASPGKTQVVRTAPYLR